MITPPTVYQIEGADVKPDTRAERRRAERSGQAPSYREMLDEAMRYGKQAYATESALLLGQAAMEEEVEQLAGPRGVHRPADRLAVRFGKARGSVVVNGRRVEIMRPRVRTADLSEEIRLESYQTLIRGDKAALGEAVMALVVEGVSENHYGRVNANEHKTPKDLRTLGVSQSSVSRYFVAATAGVVEELKTRPISGRYPVVFMDGVELGGQRAVCVVGVDERGYKKVLGLVAGETEDAVLCRQLLVDLQRRGFEPGVNGMVAVIDGGKALSSALTEMFTGRVVIARCRSHKTRNVQAKLPKTLHKWAHDSLWRAWTAPVAKGRQQMTTLAAKLERLGYEEAAGSVREGMDETLALNALGLGPETARLLGTSNVIESTFSQCGRLAHRVTYWHTHARERNRHMVMRWVAKGLEIAEDAYTRFATADQMREVDDALGRWFDRQAAVA